MVMENLHDSLSWLRNDDCQLHYNGVKRDTYQIKIAQKVLPFPALNLGYIFEDDFVMFVPSLLMRVGILKSEISIFVPLLMPYFVHTLSLTHSYSYTPPELHPPID